MSVLYEDLKQRIVEEYLSEEQNYPWIIGFSGGKDSTLTAQLCLDALLDVPPSLRKREIHILANDTLVESPLVSRHLDNQLDKIRKKVLLKNLNVKVVKTTPDVSNTFWVLLIGKGYPSPNQQLRWCTDRLKIRPTSKYILDNVSKFGHAIVVLGVRKSESHSRSKSIEKHQNIINSNLTPHTTLNGAFVYRPIVDLSTDDVWEMLSEFSPMWDSSNHDLIQLYRDANSGECPVILSQDEAPGCGTNSSRFGCWVCTVVQKDKSLQGFIDSGYDSYQFLAEFRELILKLRNDPAYRSMHRRNGNIEFKNGKHIMGPFTFEARRILLDKLLETQRNVGEILISNEEIENIYVCWENDLLNEVNTNVK